MLPLCVMYEELSYGGQTIQRIRDLAHLTIFDYFNVVIELIRSRGSELIFSVLPLLCQRL